MEDPHRYNVMLAYERSNIPVYDGFGLYTGFVDGSNCVFREFESAQEAQFFLINCRSLSSTTFVPHAAFRDGCFVNLSTSFMGVMSFFIEKRDKYFKIRDKKIQKWFPYIERKFRKKISSAVKGMLCLLRAGFTVKNLSVMNTLVFAETTSDVCFNFLDICPTIDHGSIVSQIKQIRDLMKSVIALIVIPYDHSLNGVSLDVLNFLNNNTDEYIDFMDPVWLLSDPVSMSVDEKVINLWHDFMFIEDTSRDKLGVYFAAYPREWQDWIQPDTFVEKFLNHRKQKKQKKQKSFDHAILFGFDYELGFRFVVKIGRNILNHNNETCAELDIPLSTLRTNMEYVDNYFNYLCSHFYWFISNIWFSHKFKDWKTHMFIAGGLAAWMKDPTKNVPDLVIYNERDVVERL